MKTNPQNAQKKNDSVYFQSKGFRLMSYNIHNKLMV